MPLANPNLEDEEVISLEVEEEEALAAKGGTGAGSVGAGGWCWLRKREGKGGERGLAGMVLRRSSPWRSLLLFDD